MMAGPSFPTLSTSDSIDSKPKPIRPLLERRRRWTEPNNNNNHVNNLSITTSPTRFKDSTMISSKELEDLTLLFKIQRKEGAESQLGGLSRPRRRHTTSNQHYNGRERGRTHQRSGSFNGNGLNVFRDQIDQESKSKSLDSRIVSPSSNSRDQTSTSKDQTHFQFKPSKPTFSLSLLDEDGNEIDSEEEEEMMEDYLLTPRASKFNPTFVSPSPTSVTPRASTFNLNDKSKTMEKSRPSSSLSSQGRREEMGGSLMGGMEQLRECGKFKDDEEEKRVVGLGPKSDENQDSDNEESVEDEFTDFDSVVEVEHDDEETVNNSNWIPFDSKISTSSKISSTTNWISKTIEDRTSSLSRTSSCNSISSFHSCFEDDSDSDSDSDSSDSDQEEEKRAQEEEEEENDEDNEWETLIPTKGSFLSTRRTNSSDIQVTKSLDSNITRPKIYRSSKFGSTSSLSSLGEDEKDGRIRARPLEEVKLTLPVWKCDEW